MTADLALMVLEGWHASSRLTEAGYRQMGEIAQSCAEALGDDLSDNAMSNSMIVAWLRKQPNVWEDGKLKSLPRNDFYLGLPE